jgi:hypothetical protein
MFDALRKRRCRIRLIIVLTRFGVVHIRHTQLPLYRTKQHINPQIHTLIVSGIHEMDVALRHCYFLLFEFLTAVSFMGIKYSNNAI